MQIKPNTSFLSVADIDAYSEALSFDELAEQFPADPFLCSVHSQKADTPGFSPFRRR